MTGFSDCIMVWMVSVLTSIISTLLLFAFASPSTMIPVGGGVGGEPGGPGGLLLEIYLLEKKLLLAVSCRKEGLQAEKALEV